MIKNVGLFIPSYNRPEAIIAHMQYYQKFVKHIYVVASFDDKATCEIVHDSIKGQNRVRGVFSPTRIQVAVARNYGLHFLHNDFKCREDNVKYYLMVDDDIQVSKACIMQMRKFLKENEDYGGVQAFGFGFFNENPLRKMEIGEHIEQEGGALLRAVMFRKEVVDEIGYHDPKFFFREDHDYSFRLMCSGFKQAMLKTDKVKVLNKYSKTGGFESPGFTERRREFNILGAEMMIKKYPFCSMSSDGKFMYRLKFKKLTNEQKKQFTYYQGPVELNEAVHHQDS